MATDPTPAQSDETLRKQLSKTIDDAVSNLNPLIKLLTKGIAEQWDAEELQVEMEKLKPTLTTGDEYVNRFIEIIAAERQRIFDAVEGVLPEKMTNTKDEGNSDWFYGYGYNAAIDELRAAIKRLREGA